MNPYGNPTGYAAAGYNLPSTSNAPLNYPQQGGHLTYNATNNMQHTGYANQVAHYPNTSQPQQIYHTSAISNNVQQAAYPAYDATNWYQQAGFAIPAVNETPLPVPFARPVHDSASGIQQEVTNVNSFRDNVHNNQQQQQQQQQSVVINIITAAATAHHEQPQRQTAYPVHNAACNPRAASPTANVAVEAHVLGASTPTVGELNAAITAQVGTAPVSLTGVLYVFQVTGSAAQSTHVTAQHANPAPAGNHTPIVTQVGSAVCVYFPVAAPPANDR